ERELTNFLTTAGADVSTAQTIAQSIMDWRDSDDLYRARGAEGAWYRSRGYAVLPANGPFGDVTELRHVRGVSAETYAVIAPMIAVTGDGRVNLNTAPAPVMAALPGLSPSAATRIETLRASGRQFSSVYDVALRLPQAERESIEARLPALVARTTFETERVLVESRGRTTGGRITHTAFALFERQGGTAYRTWVRHAR
ncbi:MAG: helix-hairpin-helix domain-containing protein, partial [Gemmatimonadota bacterium]